MFPPDILLPGPTPVPTAIEQAMLTPMSDHRGQLFQPIHDGVYDKLGILFQLPQDGAAAVIPSSGTGALEAAVQNFFAPNDRVLAVTTGAFGQRFAEAARAMDLEVEEMAVPWGSAFTVEEVLDRIHRASYRGVLVTHNETSTGVTNPVVELARHWPRAGDRPLLVVDSISGVPSIPLTFDEAPVDVLIAASQKGFMCPPGLGILLVSGYALKKRPTTRRGRFYFDLAPYFDRQLPYTPAVSLWYGLHQALDLLLQEGASRRWARHRLLASMTRRFGEVGGFSPLVAEPIASATVTALGVPTGLTPQAVRAAVAARGLQIAGGMGPWAKTAIRIGHVGAVTPQALFGGLAVLAHLSPRPTEALAAAWDVWRQAAQDSGPSR
ncbi:MAG: alanine--glyoxylate aminotransferase family protein [Firmicutes bacterium]|nr:alanine--glyoxylate aminotransferase family protein [Alicyclobacillaceae bacterium]MCL6498367.1 alanine--glyoxylate aminotransferase family protein [Bacillota bacterium]